MKNKYEFETMTKEEFKMIINEYEEILRDKDCEIEELKGKIERQRETLLKEHERNILLESMIRGVIE